MPAIFMPRPFDKTNEPKLYKYATILQVGQPFFFPPLFTIKSLYFIFILQSLANTFACSNF